MPSFNMIKPADFAVHMLIVADQDPIAAIQETITKTQFWGVPQAYTLATIQLIAEQAQAKAAANG